LSISKMAVLDPEENEIRALQAAAPLGGKRVLEIGCGSGRLTWRYAGAARYVAGMDLVLSRLQEARSACPPALRRKTGFVLGDATAIPCAAGSFDLAIFAWSF
jgi:ubiquinone/menaquinone biosynthesis C-methylase UbiE